MTTYEVILHYEIKNSYPPFSWIQYDEPNKTDMIKKLSLYALKHDIPKTILEYNAVLIVDSFTNGKLSDPLVYSIDLL